MWFDHIKLPKLSKTGYKAALSGQGQNEQGAVFLGFSSPRFGPIGQQITVEWSRMKFVGFDLEYKLKDPQLRDSWETLSSDEIWNLESEEALKALHESITHDNYDYKPEWGTDYQYSE